MPFTYHTKTKPIAGTSYSDVAPVAREIIRKITRRTKRRPYIRSAYFRKDKIFVSYFWNHLLQYPRYQRTRRLKYLPCAIELIQKSRLEPTTKENPNRPGELLHRFYAKSPDGVKFRVQIKEFRKTGRKELMSVFPFT